MATSSDKRGQLQFVRAATETDNYFQFEHACALTPPSGPKHVQGNNVGPQNNLTNGQVLTAVVSQGMVDMKS